MGRLITLNWRVIRGWALGLQWVVLAKMFAIMVGQKLRVKLKIIHQIACQFLAMVC